MGLTLEHKNPCIASLEFDGSKILELFDQTNTDIITQTSDSYGFNFDNESMRFRLHWETPGYRTALDPLEEYLKSKQCEILELLIENSSSTDWPKGLSRNISKELYLYTSPYIYKEGFYMQNHVDNRLSVIAGYLNLIDNDDVTFFTDGYHGKEIFRCSGKKNKIYLWLNTRDSYHSVDLIKKERKVVIFNFVLASFETLDTTNQNH